MQDLNLKIVRVVSRGYWKFCSQELILCKKVMASLSATSCRYFRNEGLFFQNVEKYF